MSRRPHLPLAERARAIDEALAASEQAGVISAGFHQAQATASADATRNGNFAFDRATIASLGMTARTPDGAGSGYWADRQKRQPTPGPVNRIIQASGRPSTPQEMIQSADRALLVTRFWYIRSVDPRTATLTGLTRDGVWWIEFTTVNCKLLRRRSRRYLPWLVLIFCVSACRFAGDPVKIPSGSLA